MTTARAAATLALLALASCHGQRPPQPVADISAVAISGCTERDAAVSATVQMDCPVRWWTGGTYCRPVEQPPPHYCTRSLGRVDCWTKPNPFGYYQRGVADGPWRLTPEQDLNRMPPWLRR